ncbi:20657_t:CDS:2 [Rhizophagus irregularis]|nr:20657_t:CDS:2 [Rhizophagus irregularis]
MANERSKDDSSEKLFSDKPLQNQRIKQQCKNLEEKNQENLRLNSELNEKNQEISRTNLNIIEENKEVSRINSELKEKLEEKEKKFEEFQQHVSNLENQRNEELQQLQKLEMMSQNLDKNLGILKLEEIDENIIKTFKENNEDFFANFSNKDPDESLPYPNIKVVVGLDFGLTYSGFSYCHVANKQNICSNEIWPRGISQFKTNTVLQYDYEYNNVLLWGAPALASRPNRRIERNKPVELFKLWLGNLDEHLKPHLPVDYKKAITDYLREIGKVIKDKIATHWSVNFFENVLLVLSVPAEYSEKDKGIMRECAYNAGLINDFNSKNLQFTTEPEAAAIYCMENKLNELQEDDIGMTFMVVDCGGGTVDLTTRKLVGINPLQLGEVKERIRDFCGSTFVDKMFIDFLLPFTGDNREFNYELDIEEYAPALLQYVDEEIREMMEENGWMINIKYNDIKLMFDPIIESILHLIRKQLDVIQETCSKMFLVGGFCENKYLQNRIKKEFQDTVKLIEVSAQPIAAISREAVVYGSNILEYKESDKESGIFSIVLKYTYGVKLCFDWKEDIDSSYSKTTDGKNFKFNPLVKRGTKVEVDQEFSLDHHNLPLSCQKVYNFQLYRTPEYNAEYCDAPGMELVGTMQIDLPEVHLGFDRPLSFGISFGHQMEITAFARNLLIGQTYVTTFGPNDV